MKTPAISWLAGAPICAAALLTPLAIHPIAASVEIYIVPPTTNSRVLPDTVFPAEMAGNDLDILASPGEYEPASFAIRNDSSTSIENITISQSSLTRVGGGGSIPSSEIDLRVVKRWWQAGLKIYALNQRQLVPELLLKDDSLVRVNASAPFNELKVAGGYVDISNPNGVFLDGVRVDQPTSAEFPVQDADTLQPFSIPAGSSKQIWVTVHVPSGTLPGDYEGTLTLYSATGGLSETVTLYLTVPDIALLPPDRTCSLYYRGRLTSAGTISSEGKDTAQFTAEHKNLVSHGVTSPTLYGQGNLTNLGTALSIRAANGVSNDRLYYLGITISGYGENLSALQSAVTQCLSAVAPYGVNHLYVYGRDEKLLSTHLAQIQTVHAAGAKIFCAENTEEKLLDALDSGLDIAVYAQEPDPYLTALYHASGREIFNYAMPQGGEETPATFRQNYGLFLRQCHYDGAMTYAYQDSFGNGWNDFDHTTYRDHNLTYPTVNGVIDTLAWEACREAVDDLRYAATLDAQIDLALVSANPFLRQAGHDARAWLNTISAREDDLDEVRREMIYRILDLKGLPAPANEPPEDLRGYWGFSGHSSLSSVFDQSGWGNAGVLVNMATAVANGSAYDEGKIGRGVVLSAGASQYVDCGMADALDLSDAITVSAWVKISSLSTASQIIYCRDDSGSRYRLNITPSGALNLYVRTELQGWHSGGVGQPHTWTDGWHHVVWTYDSATNTTKFYVDGEEDFTSTTISTGPLSDAPLLWVRLGGGENGVYFNGMLDEVKIFSRALTQSEVGKLTREGGLRAHWSFDEPAGAEVVKDVSGNGNPGFPQRIMPYESKVPGRLGRAIRLNGSAADTFDCGNDESLNRSDAITVTAWVKLSGTATDVQIIHCMDEDGSRHRLNITSSGRLNLWTRTNTQGWHSGGTGQARTWTDGWHHVAWTYDSATNTTKLYVDGQEDFTSTSITTGTLSDAPLLRVRLGGGENGVYFKGDLDDVRIYDKALSQAAIMDLANP